MANDLSTRYQAPAVAELLNLACFVDPRFKSLPFMKDDERDRLHDSILGKVMMYVVPDPLWHYLFLCRCYAWQGSSLGEMEMAKRKNSQFQSLSMRRRSLQ